MSVRIGDPGRDLRLEAQGILLGYRAVVNEEKLGHDVVRAMIEVKITPERGGGFDKLAERISRYEEVRSCHLMSGGYDLLVEVEGADLRDVAAFVSEKLSTIQEFSRQRPTSCSAPTRSKVCS